MTTLSGRAVGAAVLTLMLLLGLVACQPGRTITVLAAASLTEVFDDLAEGYRATHPGTEVRLSYGSSASLATQIREGAPADVYASANEQTMASLSEAGLPIEPELLTTNVLQIAVPPGNPADVSGLADFARPELRVALCAVEVPCGRAAAILFADAGITPLPDTYEVDVKATLRKVELGEADAALVYRTDVTSAHGRVLGLPTPGAANHPNRYQIAALPDAGDPEAAAAFVDAALSSAGQQVFRRYGFGHG